MADIKRLEVIRKEMTVNMENRLEQRSLLLKAKVATLEKHSPERRLKERKDRLVIASNQMKQNMQNLFADKVHRYEVLVAKLNGLSPTAKLVKGFGYISMDEKPVTSVENVKAGDNLRVTIHDGEIDAQIISAKKKETIT